MSSIVPHIDDLALEAFAAGEIDDSEIKQIEAHLLACEQCASVVQSIREMQHSLSALAASASSPNLVGGVERRLRRRSRGRFYGQGWTSGNRVTYLATVIIFVLLAALFALSQATYTLRDVETGKTGEELKEERLINDSSGDDPPLPLEH